MGLKLECASVGKPPAQPLEAPSGNPLLDQPLRVNVRANSAGPARSLNSWQGSLAAVSEEKPPAAVMTALRACCEGNTPSRGPGFRLINAPYQPGLAAASPAPCDGVSGYGTEDVFLQSWTSGPQCACEQF
jgi:hypothetical protein